MTSLHPWDLYSQTRDRLIALVRPLNEGQADQPVPLTPGWTITEVVAHVCGLNADVAAGMREGMGTDERTAHQVGTRAGRNVAQLCEEWLGHGDAMRAAIDEDGFFGRRLSADLVVHLHDLQHALGEPIDREDEATVSGGQTYAARTPDRLLELTEVGLVIELSEGARFEPSSGAAVGNTNAHAVPVDSTLTLRTTAYDFLRSVTGRRSGTEVRSLDWTGDPSPILDRFSPYGPLRTTDAGV